MKIFVKLMKTVALDVNPSYTIEDIKAKVYEIEEGCAHMLFYGGHHLRDATRTLTSYNIPEYSTINAYIRGGMQFSVKMPNGKTIMLIASGGDTVKRVKAMIYNKEGIVPEQQALFFSCRLLEDHQILTACDVKKDSVLQMVLRPVVTDDLDIQVSMLHGKNVALRVKTWFTVRDVKIMIETVEGVPALCQMLVYDGKRLENERKISEYKIADNSVIQLQVQLQIFINTTNGGTLTLLALDSNTIAEVLENIGKKMGHTLRDHVLLHAGRILDKDKIVGDCNVGNESTLNLRAAMPMSYLK